MYPGEVYVQIDKTMRFNKERRDKDFDWALQRGEERDKGGRDPDEKECQALRIRGFRDKR